MTFEDFKTRVNKVLEEASIYEEDYRLDKGYLGVSWTAGGQSGGSCWDTSDRVYHSVDADAPEDIKSLDVIISHFNPDIKFMEYKLIIADLIETGTYSDGGDYYGNYYNYAYKKFSLRKLYDKFNDKEWF